MNSNIMMIYTRWRAASDLLQIAADHDSQVARATVCKSS
jgi:hypothetical protein